MGPIIPDAETGSALAAPVGAGLGLLVSQLDTYTRRRSPTSV